MEFWRESSFASKDSRVYPKTGAMNIFDVIDSGIIKVIFGGLANVAWSGDFVNIGVSNKWTYYTGRSISRFFS